MVEPIIVIATPDEVEAACLRAMLVTAPTSSVVIVAVTADCLLSAVNDCLAQGRLAALLADTRIYEDPKVGTNLSIALRSARLRLPVLLLHYSATLTDAIIRSRMAAVDQSSDLEAVDRADAGWLQKISSILTVHLAGRRFLKSLEDFDLPRPASRFPVYPSITSELILIKALAVRFLGQGVHHEAEFSATKVFGAEVHSRRFGYSPPVARLQLSPNNQTHPEVHSSGHFDIKWWRNKRSQGEKSLWPLVRRLGSLLDRRLEAMVLVHRNLRERAASLRINVWLVDGLLESEFRAESTSLRQMWAEMPFVDCCDKYLTLAFPRRLEFLFDNVRALDRIVAHEFMHLCNRLDYGTVEESKVWFDEALANWYSLRVVPDESPQMKMSCLPIDSLENRYGGLAFAKFVECKLGSTILTLALQRSSMSIYSVIAAAGKVTTTELLVEFFYWALQEKLLEEDTTGRGQVTMAHCSCFALKIPTGAESLVISSPSTHPVEMYVLAVTAEWNPFSGMRASVIRSNLFSIEQVSRFSHCLLINLRGCERPIAQQLHEIEINYEIRGSNRIGKGA